MEGLAEAGGRRQYSCPARFVRMGNSCYFMSTLMAPWHEAHFRCRSMGAHLAAFEKRWENRNMRKFLMREELGTYVDTPISLVLVKVVWVKGHAAKGNGDDKTSTEGSDLLPKTCAHLRSS